MVRKPKPVAGSEMSCSTSRSTMEPCGDWKRLSSSEPSPLRGGFSGRSTRRCRGSLSHTNLWHLVHLAHLSQVDCQFGSRPKPFQNNDLQFDAGQFQAHCSENLERPPN